MCKPKSGATISHLSTTISKNGKLQEE